jgi:hypothetical protein
MAFARHALATGVGEADGVEVCLVHGGPKAAHRPCRAVAQHEPPSSVAGDDRLLEAVEHRKRNCRGDFVRGGASGWNIPPETGHTHVIGRGGRCL